MKCQHCLIFQSFLLDSIPCAENGDFIFTTIPTCAVPKVCENAPTPSNESGLAGPAQSSVKSFRSVEYECRNSSLVMDTHGKKYKLECGEDGSFAAPTWAPSGSIVCREAKNCTETIPTPPESSLLQNSTSNLADMMEWDKAIYKCKDSNHVVGKSLRQKQHICIVRNVMFNLE